MRTDLETLWRLTQEPAEHPRWDLRFSSITPTTALDSGGAAGDLTEKSYLSGIEDLDVTSAIADFYQRETSLKATQLTFARLSNIALFNYI